MSAPSLAALPNVSYARMMSFVGKGLGMNNPPGSVQGLHLVVSDIQAARAELVERGVEVSEVKDFGGGISMAFFKDLDGNSWAVQHIAPGARRPDV